MEKLVELLQKENAALYDGLRAIADIVGTHLHNASAMLNSEMKHLQQRRRELQIDYDQLLLDGSGPQASILSRSTNRSLRKYINKTYSELSDDDTLFKKLVPFFENKYFGMTLPCPAGTETPQVCMEGIRHVAPDDLHFQSGWVRVRYDNQYTMERAFCLHLKPSGSAENHVLIFRISNGPTYALVWSQLESRWCRPRQMFSYFTYHQFMTAWLAWGKSIGKDVGDRQVINASTFFMKMHEAYGDLYDKMTLKEIDHFNASVHYTDFEATDVPNPYYKERRQFAIGMRGHCIMIGHSATVRGELQLPHEFNCRITITRDRGDDKNPVDWYKLDPYTQELVINEAMQRFQLVKEAVTKRLEGTVAT